jgi:hypothetical protein
MTKHSKVSSRSYLFINEETMFKTIHHNIKKKRERHSQQNIKITFNDSTLFDV